MLVLARLALLLVLPLGAFSAAATEEVTIYRDTWGVPHIYGDTAEGAAYGHGWAQAEDRLEDVLLAYRIAEGRAASVLGQSQLERDLVARAARHAAVARSRYAELHPRTRRIVEAFVAGIGAYMREHPAETPGWAAPPEPWKVVALYRAFAWAWPWGQALRELRAAGRPAAEEQEERGSNQWVVGPGRSAEGAPIALIDPHLSWEPVNRFYEAHVHGGGLDFFGFSIVGTPVMAVGHNDYLAFSCTTGGPDTADVYELRLHPEDPRRYEHDGGWRSIEVEETTIEVRTPGGLRTENRTIERTHHGPILKREAGRAWVARTAYDAEAGLIEQWLGMAGARNLGEFLGALRANQALPQNIMYADVHGNTFYVRAGRVPVRPEGFSWDRPVPGWTSQTEWLGIHPFADLVQVLNPPGGWMQNCNVSPAMMTPESPLTASRYLPYLYNIRPERTNARGRRVTELLEGRRKLTLEYALQIAVDTYVDRAGRWQQALAGAYATHGARFEGLGPAVELLRGWDGRMDPDSRAAALFRFLVRACREEGSRVPTARIEDGESIDGAAQEALLGALERASRGMRERLGRLDVPWGEVHRVRRGERSWPVGGCGADGIGTLRAVRTSEPDARGVSWVDGGQLGTTVVLLREGGVVSYSATPYGQSDRPDSPHFTDQGEKLFSRGRLKPTWYAKAELLEHVETRRALTVPRFPGQASN
jgi:penicillin amidase